jgi:hypothetical protein
VVVRRAGLASFGQPAQSAVHCQLVFRRGWSVGTSPTIKVDWKASSGDQVTFPFGPSVGKVVKFGDAFPVKFEIQALHSPIHPESNGQIFQIQFTAIPVVPGLIDRARLGS